jgi:effector-binding domain-containing protein
MKHPWHLILALSLAVLGCEKPAEEPKAEKPQEEPAKEAPAEPDVAAQILDQAIEAHGGADKLKAIAAVTAQVEGQSPLGAFTATSIVARSHHRMDIKLENGNQVTFTRGPEHCWAKKGPVIIPMGEGEKKSHQATAALMEALLLWPVKQKGLVTAAGKVKIDNEECDQLKLKWPDLDAEGSLVFDPQSHLLIHAGVKTPKEEIEITLSEHQEFCGVKMASRRVATLNGKPMQLIMVKEAGCAPVGEETFQKPEQVADKTIGQRPTTQATIACTTLKGPYTGLEKALQGLVQELADNKVPAIGRPLMIYKRGPPRVKKPKKWVTQVCFPVNLEAPKKPKKQGKLVIMTLKPGQALAAYGIGDYAKKAPELAALLVKEAKKRKLKPKGPMIHLTYMDAQTTPPAELVSELLLPLK